MLRVYVAILALLACSATAVPAAEAPPSAVGSRVEAAEHGASARFFERDIVRIRHVLLTEATLDDVDPDGDDTAWLVARCVEARARHEDLVGATSVYSRARARLGDFPGLSRGPPA